MTNDETNRPTRELLPARISLEAEYASLVTELSSLIEAARRSAARAVNAAMTVTYWQIGCRMIEFEQRGHSRAEYGEQVLDRLAGELTRRFGRGFGRSNLAHMRAFYLAWPRENIVQTVSGQFGFSSADQQVLLQRFQLPWSTYVQLLSLTNPTARDFYESQALRGGWSVRQLNRQISTQFYERVRASHERARKQMLKKAGTARPEEILSPEEEIRDSYLLEFAGLKDEYSETELEEALVQRMEQFMLELGDDFTFVGRQRRLRLDNQWYRVDLILFHRRLRCLVIIDLKTGDLSGEAAGKMHLYLNYAKEHWTRQGENPPVGLILCARASAAVARYALTGLDNNVMAAEYSTVLPEVKQIESEMTKARRAIEDRLRRHPKRASDDNMVRDEPQRPIWEALSQMGRQAPPGTWDNVPGDLSERVDEYIYGKRRAL